MPTKKEWIFYIIVPLLATLLIDLASKSYAFSLEPGPIFGWLRIAHLHNHGLLLGGLSDSSKIFTIVVPSTIGSFCVFLFLVIQFFLPIKSLAMRAALGILLGGILGNVYDKMTFGYVRDFLLVESGRFKSGVFNVSDALQWCGLAVAIGAYLVNGHILYPPNERRGRKWINPDFQLRYCLTLIAMGAAFSLVSGALSYSFLTIMISDLAGVAPQSVHVFLRSYLLVYAIATSAFLVSLFVIGVFLSHRIIGPIKNFEGFLDGLLRGTSRRVQLRRGDEFRHFEDLAQKYQEFFHARLGIEPDGLEKGMPAPDFVAKTYDGAAVSLRAYLGRKVWIIFYRYASCPLCAYDLGETKSVIEAALAANFAVLIVYESKPKDFMKANTPAINDLMRSVGVPLISDPDRHIYRLFRTRQSVRGFLHLSLLPNLVRAFLKKFRQTLTFENLRQLPASFVIDEQGTLIETHYGEHFSDHAPLQNITKFFS